MVVTLGRFAGFTLGRVEVPCPACWVSTEGVGHIPSIYKPSRFSPAVMDVMLGKESSAQN